MLDPLHNLDVGTAHLVMLHRQYRDEGLEDVNDFLLSSLSYNQGEGSVKSAIYGQPGEGKGILLGYYAKIKQAASHWKESGF